MADDRTTRQLAKYVESAREASGEDVRAVTVLSRPGGVAMVGAHQVSGLAGMVMGRIAKRKSGGLPMNVLVGVTPTHVIAWDYRPRGFHLSLRTEVARWPREGLRVTTEPGTVATRVTFTNAVGETVELDSNLGSGRMLEVFLAELGASA